MTLPDRRADLRAMQSYHSPQIDVPIRLNTNESPYPPPEAFIDAWLSAVREIPLNRYPDRSARGLRVALAEQMGVAVDQVFCANGSNEVLQTLLLVYGGPGRKALVFEPTYALHSHIARITGTEVITGERASDFSVSTTEAGLLIAAERPEVVFLCSPNNPTGTFESRATIEALLSAVVDHGSGLLVVDEAYGEFSDWSALELVDDDLPLVVTRTYSKVWSLAALRLGFAVGPAPVVANLDEFVLPYHLSAPTQEAGMIALTFADEMRVRVDTIIGDRQRLAAALGRLPGLSVYPSGANFLLVAAPGLSLWAKLVDNGILVRDFSSRARLEDCVRITIGTPEENKSLLAAIAAILEETSP